MPDDASNLRHERDRDSALAARLSSLSDEEFADLRRLTAGTRTARFSALPPESRESAFDAAVDRVVAGVLASFDRRNAARFRATGAAADGGRDEDASSEASSWSPAPDAADDPPEVAS